MNGNIAVYMNFTITVATVFIVGFILDRMLAAIERRVSRKKGERHEEGKTEGTG